jgi:hypothetical protein
MSWNFFCMLGADSKKAFGADLVVGCDRLIGRGLI